MAYIGNLTSFDHKTGEWQIFKSKLLQFLKINEVKEDNRSGILLTYLTDETYRLLRNLAYPKELDLLKFSDLILLLDSHFKPKQCSFADKANFYGAIRHPGETIGEWVARIRGLASYCDFGTALETNLRNRFVLGLGSGPERDKLFEQNASTLTLARAIELAEQAACVKEAKVMMCNTETVRVKEEPIYKVKIQAQHGCGETRQGGVGGASSAGSASGAISGDFSRCSVCGLKNHSSDKCRYKSYKCSKCGKKGHLKKVCKDVKDLSVYHVDNGQGEPSDSAMLCCEECQNFNIRCPN